MMIRSLSDACRGKRRGFERFQMLSEQQACKHNELEDIPNLHVMMVLRSLASHHYLQEIYSWRWHYYTLTNEGIEYLREVLHLPAQVFPQTLTKQRPTRPALAGGESEGGGGKGKGKGAWDQDRGDSQSQQNMPKCSNQLHRCIAMSGHSLLIVEAINQLSATAEGYTNLTLIANLAGRELNDHQ